MYDGKGLADMILETKKDTEHKEGLTTRCASIVRKLLLREAKAVKNGSPTAHASTQPSVDLPQETLGAAHTPYVLIDDDFLIRMGWETEAEEKKIPLHTYDCASSFLQNLKYYEKTAKIYIDVSLGDGAMSGEALAQKLHDLGYRAIHLATGYDKESFGHMPWLAGIHGKNPPF